MKQLIRYASILFNLYLIDFIFIRLRLIDHNISNIIVIIQYTPNTLVLINYNLVLNYNISTRPYCHVMGISHGL